MAIHQELPCISKRYQYLSLFSSWSQKFIKHRDFCCFRYCHSARNCCLPMIPMRFTRGTPRRWAWRRWTNVPSPRGFWTRLVEGPGWQASIDGYQEAMPIKYEASKVNTVGTWLLVIAVGKQRYWLIWLVAAQVAMDSQRRSWSKGGLPWTSVWESQNWEVLGYNWDGWSLCHWKREWIFIVILQ